MNVAPQSSWSPLSATGNDEAVVISLPADVNYSTPPLFTSKPLRSPHKGLIPAGREKRKRTRVSDEQLLMLERIFATDRNPAGTKRREIGNLVGMHERQTQIWFQNRRAKARSQEMRQRELMGFSEPLPPPETPPKLSRGFEIELHNLLHEDNSIIIFPCTELSIGKWRRIVSSQSACDVITYGCEARQSFTWFIHSKGHGYKMELSMDSVLDAQFTSVTPETSRATLLLARPPDFYLQNYEEPLAAHYVSTKFWKPCQDWTEDRQASRSLRHVLTGPAPYLTRVLKSLLAAGSAEVQLNTTPSEAPNQTSYSPAPLSPLQLPLQPMTGFMSPENETEPVSEGAGSPAPLHITRRRLSSTASSVISHHSSESDASFSTIDSDYPSHPTPSGHSSEAGGVPHVVVLQTHYSYRMQHEACNDAEEQFPDVTQIHGDFYPSHTIGSHYSLGVSQECLEAPQQLWKPYRTDKPHPHQETFHGSAHLESYAENPTNPLQHHRGAHDPTGPNHLCPPPGTLLAEYLDVIPDDQYGQIVVDHPAIYDFGPEHLAPYVSFHSHP